MSKVRRLEFIAWAISLCSCSACAQEPSVEAFRQQLIEPIDIHAALIYSDRLAQLSQSQRESILRARGVLGEFFKRLERVDGNPRSLMTDEYAGHTGDRQSIRQALVAYETTVLQIRVTDFSLMNEDALQLTFYATTFSEGTYSVGERQATLQRVGGTWRVDAIVIDP